MITHKFWRVVMASFLATTVAITSSSSYADNLNRVKAFHSRNNPAIGGRGTPGFSDGLFGHHAVVSNQIGPFSRWQAVATRFAAERKNASAYCKRSQIRPCPVVVWNQLIDSLRALPLSKRVRMVNRYFNHISYVRAEINWGDPGYWETPFQFLSRGGQCQDYAIAKYFALRESGLSEDALRFVVVYDNISKQYHAITVVDLDGDLIALDNQMADVTSVADLAFRYVPYYSLNDLAWWPYASAIRSANTARPANRLMAFSTSVQIPRY